MQMIPWTRYYLTKDSKLPKGYSLCSYSTLSSVVSSPGTTFFIKLPIIPNSSSVFQAGFDVLLVPSLTGEMNKLFDVCLLYICISHDL